MVIDGCVTVEEYIRQLEQSKVFSDYLHEKGEFVINTCSKSTTAVHTNTQASATAPQPDQTHAMTLLLPTVAGTIFSLRCAELIACEAFNKMSIIHYEDTTRAVQQPSIVYGLGEIERCIGELAPEAKAGSALVRCHKSQIVNLAHCTAFRHTGHRGIFECRGGVQVKVGRKYKPDALAAWRSVRTKDG
jgi:hypothetical protein